MSDTNYVQVDANGFKCLNGHPVVQKTYDGSPWLCNDPSCKYSVKTVEPKLSPNPSEDRWLDELFAKEIATNEPYLNKGWSLAKAKITSHYEQRMQEEVRKASLISRRFGQPNKNTFTIHPIKQLVGRYAGSGVLKQGLWCDPFAGKHSPASVTNDINPNVPADYHLDALEFLRQQPSSHFDGVLYDPPYSITQAKEVYDNHGSNLFDPTNMDYWSKCKDEIARILKPNSLVVCCGWNSNGLGKSRGFELLEILLVPHGGSRNDTIVTVEALKAVKKESNDG